MAPKDGLSLFLQVVHHQAYRYQHIKIYLFVQVNLRSILLHTLLLLLLLLVALKLCVFLKSLGTLWID